MIIHKDNTFLKVICARKPTEPLPHSHRYVNLKARGKIENMEIEMKFRGFKPSIHPKKDPLDLLHNSCVVIVHYFI